MFARVQARLKAQVGPDVFSSWFGRLQLESVSDHTARLSVPTTFLRSWINNRYIDLIARLFTEEDASINGVEIVVRSATRGARLTASSRTVEARRPGADAAPPAAGDASGAERGERITGSPLDTRYSFANFVEGPSNRLALAAAKTVVEAGSGAARFNPLFIHSSVGQGKTHLLQAIALAVREGVTKPRVVYLTAEYFMWRFATALRDRHALAFKESLRNIDLLVIDDMQFLQGGHIQHEFCHLLNMLLDSARQVVVAADRAPPELESLDARVRSRLSCGVALEIGPPDYAMRLEILKRHRDAARKEDESLNIPEEILAHVARQITSSGRELEGAFNQLLFRRSFEPTMSIYRVDELLCHLVDAREPKQVRIEDIQRVVSRHYNVSRQEMVSNRRTRAVVKPRQIAMFLAKTMTPRSFPEIGRRFGGRDHTTVLHAVRKIENLIEKDTAVLREVELLRQLIGE